MRLNHSYGGEAAPREWTTLRPAANFDLIAGDMYCTTVEHEGFINSEKQSQHGHGISKKGES